MGKTIEANLKFLISQKHEMSHSRVAGIVGGTVIAGKFVPSTTYYNTRIRFHEPTLLSDGRS